MGRQRRKGARGSRLGGANITGQVPSASQAMDRAIREQYKNAEMVIDQGYERWLNSGVLSARNSALSYLESKVQSPGRLLINKDGADVYLFQMTFERGANILPRTFFFLVEENLTHLSNQTLRTITPWSLIMQTWIQLRIPPKTPLRKTAFTQMIKSGGDTIAASVSQSPEIKNLFYVRYDYWPAMVREIDG